MKSRSLQDYTIEELNSKKKALRNATIVIVGLILMSSVYFIANLIMGTWKANTMLPVVGMSILVIASSTVSSHLAKVAKELHSRNKN